MLGFYKAETAHYPLMLGFNNWQKPPMTPKCPVFRARLCFRTPTVNGAQTFKFTSF